MYKKEDVIHIYAEDMNSNIKKDLLWGYTLGISKVCYHFLELPFDKEADSLKKQLLSIEELRKMAKEFGYEEISLQFMEKCPHESYVEVYKGEHHIRIKTLKELISESKEKDSLGEKKLTKRIKE